MKVPLLGVIRILLGLATVSACLRADETAEQLVATARARATEMSHGELAVLSRELTLDDLRAGAQRNTGRAAYQRLLVTWRSPGDWRLAYKRETQIDGHGHGSTSYVFSRVGEDAGMMMLSAEDNDRVEMKLPPKIFFQEARQRIGSWGGPPAGPPGREPRTRTRRRSARPGSEPTRW